MAEIRKKYFVGPPFYLLVSLEVSDLLIVDTYLLMWETLYMAFKSLQPVRLESMLNFQVSKTQHVIVATVYIFGSRKGNARRLTILE